MIILVAIAGLVLAAKFLGIRLYAITSASMEPTYKVYDVVIVKKADYESIKAGEDGDVITFFVKDSQTATHRAIAKNDISKTFQTKGDNNETIDAALVRYENVVGKVLFSIPQLGRITSLFGGVRGKIVLIAIIIVLTVALLLWDDDSKKGKKGAQPDKKKTDTETDNDNDSAPQQDNRS